jgi:hypothetical protein
VFLDEVSTAHDEGQELGLVIRHGGFTLDLDQLSESIAMEGRTEALVDELVEFGPRRRVAVLLDECTTARRHPSCRRRQGTPCRPPQCPGCERIVHSGLAKAGDPPYHRTSGTTACDHVARPWRSGRAGTGGAVGLQLVRLETVDGDIQLRLIAFHGAKGRSQGVDDWRTQLVDLLLVILGGGGGVVSHGGWNRGGRSMEVRQRRQWWSALDTN